jgi:hypothetical protein
MHNDALENAKPCDLRGWPQAQNRFRLNLLTSLPALQRFLRSKLWPEDINFKFTAIVYPAFVALLLFGPQDRAHNFGLNLFWCYWWPLIFVVYPFLGRIWCAGAHTTHSLCRSGLVMPGNAVRQSRHNLVLQQV